MANGPQDVTQRIARRLEQWTARNFRTADLDFPLLVVDIADSHRLAAANMAPRRTNGSLNIAWICTPPSPGSGGHTTFFRMVEGLEKQGHRCTILLYNRHGSNLGVYREIIHSNWPGLSAVIQFVPDRIEGYDACVASSWETAHVLASRGDSASFKFYFIQDYEPYFYPRGSLYALAEDTYRFGFRHIALGEMVHQILKHEAEVDASVVPFGCDTGVYKLNNSGERSGVVFFARPHVDRRGFHLALLALSEFHRRQPEQTITIYGDPVPNWNVPHRYVGRLSPKHLNVLYNQSVAGLAMSFTNVSLVPEEMLAAGVRPVVNDSGLARMGLANEHISWAPATPGGLADALSLAVETPLSPAQRAKVAASVRSGWEPAQQQMASEIERTCAQRFPAGHQVEGAVDGHDR
jgi:O-antigen biosynthesis protein